MKDDKLDRLTHKYIHDNELDGLEGGGGEPGATDHGALTGLADDDHPQYQTESEVDAQVASGIDDHEAEANPHPGYLTQAEADALYADDPHTHLEADITDFAHSHVEGDLPSTLATDTEVATAVSTHAGAADPHTGYQKESEKGSASGYASLDAAALVPTDELGTGTADDTVFLRGDQTWQVVAGGGGTTIVQQDDEPASPVEDDLWIDTDESAGVGLSSIIGYTENASLSQSGITAVTDITGLSVTVTVPAGRRIRVSGQVRVDGSGPGDRYSVLIREGSTTLQTSRHTFTGSLQFDTSVISVVLSPTAGSHTYKLSLLGVGSGSMTAVAVAGEVAYIMVEDITGTLWPAGQSIGAGTIAPEAWTPWTPTLGNVTLGTGYSLDCAYQQIGGTVYWRFYLLLGTGGALTGIPHFSLPVLAKVISGWGPPTSWGVYSDANGGRAGGTIEYNTSTTARFAFWQNNTNHPTINYLGATLPFTWTNGDEISAGGFYEVDV